MPLFYAVLGVLLSNQPLFVTSQNDTSVADDDMASDGLKYGALACSILGILLFIIGIIVVVCRSRSTSFKGEEKALYPKKEKVTLTKVKSIQVNSRKELVNSPPPNYESYSDKKKNDIQSIEKPKINTNPTHKIQDNTKVKTFKYNSVHSNSKPQSNHDRVQGQHKQQNDRKHISNQVKSPPEKQLFSSAKQLQTDDKLQKQENASNVQGLQDTGNILHSRKYNNTHKNFVKNDPFSGLGDYTSPYSMKAMKTAGGKNNNTVDDPFVPSDYTSPYSMKSMKATRTNNVDHINDPFVAATDYTSPYSMKAMKTTRGKESEKVKDMSVDLTGDYTSPYSMKSTRAARGRNNNTVDDPFVPSDYTSPYSMKSMKATRTNNVDYINDPFVAATDYTSPYSMKTMKTARGKESEKVNDISVDLSGDYTSPYSMKSTRAARGKNNNIVDDPFVPSEYTSSYSVKNMKSTRAKNVDNTDDLPVASDYAMSYPMRAKNIDYSGAKRLGAIRMKNTDSVDDSLGVVAAAKRRASRIRRINFINIPFKAPDYTSPYSVKALQAAKGMAITTIDE